MNEVLVQSTVPAGLAEVPWDGLFTARPEYLRGMPPVSAGLPPTRAEDAAPSFDALLVQIGTELLSAPLDAIDAAIDRALRRLIVFLAIERGEP
jgi:hypothetical protein